MLIHNSQLLSTL